MLERKIKPGPTERSSPGARERAALSRADRKVLSDVVIFVQRFTCGKVVDEVWEVVNCRLRRALLAVVRSC